MFLRGATLLAMPRLSPVDSDRPRRLGAALVALALLLAPVAGALAFAEPAAASSQPAVPAAGPSPIQPGCGNEATSLQLVSQKTLSARSEDLTFQTPALAQPTTVRVLLPDGYDPSGATRYPVLYLLHGGAANYTSWTQQGGAADALTAGLPLITVMPDAGLSAWYTDWYNNGALGQPMWETYHVAQLIPWIDAHFSTVASREGRAIVGLSSGGFGTMSYASRHPDLFVAAAAFSGAVDTNTPPAAGGVVIDGLASQDGGGPGSLFGLRETEEVRWRGHNPWDLANNLRGMSLTVRTGNGQAGGTYGGGGPTDPVGSGLETAVHLESVSFNDRLNALGIDHVWEDYGPGTHSFPYWNRDLSKTLPLLMQVFAEHRPAPSTFSFRAIEPTYCVYGWRVTLDRPALEFSSLEDASAAGFSLSGSGTATVVTGPLYQAGKTYGVTTKSSAATDAVTLHADPQGRLHIAVPLGLGNPVQQQFAPTGDSPATLVYTTRVSIADGSAPGVDVPEAPIAALLPVAALALFAVGGYARSRRQHR